jgi:hypothetical protein
MAVAAALGAAPIVAIAVFQSAAPAFADTPGVSPTCFPQASNPHPTEPVGQSTNSLFCAPAASSATPGSGNNGSGGSGGRTGTGTGAGTTAGGGQTSLASTSDSSGSIRDESGHALNGSWSSSGQPAAPTDTGLFGGLVGFFASAGGLAFLFGLLMLMLIVLIALAVITAIRRGGKNFASRFSRVTYRA